MKHMKDDPQILRVETDQTRRWQSAPSDSFYSDQWALPKISWDQVYGTANPRFFTKVAILDTGVDASHPDLSSVVVPGYSVFENSPVKVLSTDGLGQDSDIINGLMWAVDNGASVVLMAFSNPGFSEALQDAIDYAWAHDVVLVAAAGNDGNNTPTFPAGDRGVIGVSSTDQNDTLSSSSTFGPSVFLAAPGVDIRGTGLRRAI
jgi:subtilisin family serine protease